MVPQKTPNKLRKRRVLRHVMEIEQRASELCNNAAAAGDVLDVISSSTFNLQTVLDTLID